MGNFYSNQLICEHCKLIPIENNSYKFCKECIELRKTLPQSCKYCVVSICHNGSDVCSKCCNVRDKLSKNTVDDETMYPNTKIKITFECSDLENVKLKVISTFPLLKCFNLDETKIDPTDIRLRYYKNLYTIKEFNMVSIILDVEIIH